MKEIIEKINISPYYADKYGIIYNIDCFSILKELSDVENIIVITDPPYGINLDTNNFSQKRSRLCKANDYPKIYGDDKPFDPGPLIKYFYDKPMFLFGANYYHTKLPQSGAWIAWDKTGGGRIMNDNADIELIWSNLNFAPRIFHHHWSGFFKASEMRQKRVHPTQKPVKLIEWILQKFIKDTNKIVFDPFLGSGSTILAAKNLGYKYIGIEISKDYCEIAKQRVIKGK